MFSLPFRPHGDDLATPAILAPAAPEVSVAAFVADAPEGAAALTEVVNAVVAREGAAVLTAATTATAARATKRIM